ncbi:DUF2141 domain-containing protein [Erythrobacter sp. NFXS35]|uniref:DUF2141 domain-containing protein n=1 Tax=Erythrobacter sp. NFXS35 TaxID=2818436 RepID=UPI0032DE5D4B
MRYLLAAMMLCGFASPAHADDITIALQGVKKDTGTIVLCLWANGDRFPDCESGKPLQRIVVPANASSARFDNVATGTYAVSAFHDANNNGRLDSNFIGLPLESVGMSNNPKLNGPPRFKPARFKVAGQTKIRIRFQSL